jgi:hypothetical protein
MKPRKRYGSILFVVLAACTGSGGEMSGTSRAGQGADSSKEGALSGADVDKTSRRDEISYKVRTNKVCPDGGAENRVEPDEARLERLRAEPIVGARLISGRTLSLKVELKNGDVAVFKPILKNDSRAPREVAVFRLSGLLDVAVVPLSTMRSVPLDPLVRLLNQQSPKRAAELLEEAFTDEKGRVPGAIIQWIFGLDPSGLEKIGGRIAIKKWLASARPLKGDPRMASNAADMIAFDYLIGNWDRFSGGNVFVSASGFQFVLLDHNGSLAPWSDRQQRKMEKLLAQTHRFPAGLIKRVRDLKAENIERSMAAEPWNENHPLMTPEEIDLLLARRDRLIAHVDRLIRIHGKDAALPFP